MMPGPAKQEKGLVTAIVDLREHNGTADEAGQLMICEGRDGTGEVEEIAMLEFVVKIAVFRFAVKLVRAGLICYTEHPAGGVSAIGRQDRAHHFHFLDGVLRRGHDAV